MCAIAVTSARTSNGVNMDGSNHLSHKFQLHKCRISRHDASIACSIATTDFPACELSQCSLCDLSGWFDCFERGKRIFLPGCGNVTRETKKKPYYSARGLLTLPWERKSRPALSECTSFHLFTIAL